MRSKVLAVVAMGAGIGAYLTVDRATTLAIGFIGVAGVVILIDKLIDTYEKRASRRFHAEVEREVRRRLKEETW